MNLSEYQAKCEELEQRMEELNQQESEKKMELSIKYQATAKKISSQIGALKHQRAEAEKEYQKDKSWWHMKFLSEKQNINQRMLMLRVEYLTIDNIESKENRITPPSGGEQRNGKE